MFALRANPYACLRTAPGVCLGARYTPLQPGAEHSGLAFFEVTGIDEVIVCEDCRALVCAAFIPGTLLLFAFNRHPEHLTPNMLSGKSILITGGTGSFGQAFVGRVLKEYPDVHR